MNREGGIFRQICADGDSQFMIGGVTSCIFASCEESEVTKMLMDGWIDWTDGYLLRSERNGGNPVIPRFPDAEYPVEFLNAKFEKPRMKRTAHIGARTPVNAFRNARSGPILQRGISPHLPCHLFLITCTRYYVIYDTYR